MPLLDYRTHDPDLVDYLGTSIQNPYFQGHQAAFQYCHDVLNGIRQASENEKKAVRRFLSDLERKDIRLDLNVFAVVLAVANSLKHSKGPIAGTPIKLLPWMQFDFLNMFCWVYTDEAADGLKGQRRFQKALIHVARGNAKTQLSAIATIVSLLLTRNGSPTVTTSASTRKQAAICFNEIASQIKSSTKSLKKRFKVQANEIRVKGGGSIFPTSSEADSLDGLRICVGILDEAHAHKDSSVHDAIVSGVASSADPLVMMISTAGNPNTFYHDSYRHAVTILDGLNDNDRLFIHIFEAEPNLEADDEIAYEQANPSIDHAVSRTTLRANYLNSLVSPAAQAGFRTKHLNVFYEHHESMTVDTETIFNCEGELPPDEELKKLECYIGIDLASVSDLSTIACVWPSKDGKNIYCRTHSFLPRVALEAVPSGLMKHYKEAVYNGTLTLSDGPITDEDQLHDHLKMLCSRYRVQAIGIDAAAGGHRFAAQHEETHGGYEVLAVQQGFGLSESISRWVKAMYAGQFKYPKADNLFKWTAHNCRSDVGLYGDIRIHKPKNDHALKVDPVVATVIALSLVPPVEFSPQMR